jgi:hypothetical protein
MLVGDDAITGAGVSPILIIRLPMAIIIRRLPGYYVPAYPAYPYYAPYRYYRPRYAPYY